MNVSDIGVVFGICTSLLMGSGAAGNYYLQHEYVSGDALQEFELRGLNREARKLKRKLDEGQEELRNDYLDLLDDIEDLEREMQ